MSSNSSDFKPAYQKNHGFRVSPSLIQIKNDLRRDGLCPDATAAQGDAWREVNVPWFDRGQVIDRDGQANSPCSAYSKPVFKTQTGKHMKKYIVLILLGMATMAGAVLEGLVEGLSPQLVQVNGLLTILCTGVFIFWTLKLQAGGFSQG